MMQTKLNCINIWLQKGFQYFNFAQTKVKKKLCLFTVQQQIPTEVHQPVTTNKSIK